MTKYCLASGKTYERYKYKNSRLFKFYDGSGWFKLVYEDHPDGSIARIDVYPTYFEAEDPSLAWSEFNENGLLKKEGSEKERAGYNVKYLISDFKYNFDGKGRVSSVVEYRKNKKETKVVFSYKNAPKTKNKTKYLYSINSCVGYLNYGMRAATSKGKIAI